MKELKKFNMKIQLPVLNTKNIGNIFFRFKNQKMENTKKFFIQKIRKNLKI